MAQEPSSQLSRYAFGYSDKKPGFSFWLIHAGMIGFIVYQLGFGGLSTQDATTQSDAAQTSTEASAHD